MAHVRVEFAGDVLVTSLAQEVHGFIEMLFVDDTGVVGASDEKNWHIGIMHSPIFLAISLVHKLEEGFEAIEREDEAVAFICVVGGENCGVADNPGVGIAFVFEAFHIFGEGEVIDKVATVFFAFEQLQGFGNDNAEARGELIAGRAADNEAVDVAVVFLEIATYDEGAHAMTEESEGKTGEAGADVLSDLVGVFDDSGDAVFTEITEVVFGFDAGAVAAVVVNDDDEALLGAVVHEIVIAFAVLGHAVNEL